MTIFYIIFFSDMGIVINISITQWIVEVAVYIFSLVYMSFVAGHSSDLDKFFTLFLAGFTMIVLPAFYLNGDIEFRTDMAQNGYFNALKNALFVKEPYIKNISNLKGKKGQK